MAQRRGEVGVSQAARILEVHPNTVRRWARRAIEGDPEARIEQARRDMGGRFWLDRDEVLSLRQPAEDAY